MGQRNVLNEYEQLRIKRMQENSRKLQELGLENAKDTFTAKKAAPKPKPQISRQKDDTADRRRSSRVAALPALNYEDKDTLNLRGQRICRPAGPKKKRGIAASSAAMEEACEAAEKIDCKFPSIVKQMMPSHVAGEPILGADDDALPRIKLLLDGKRQLVAGLPRGFCAAHMPGQDMDMTLVDEDGGQWESRYLAHKNGLSGGWRGFALDHSLEYGDVVIFELIKPTTLQVHIIRVADHESGGGASVTEPSKSRKQAKRKTGTRYENVPVQGRGKKPKVEQSDSENEESDQDDEEDEEDEDEKEEDEDEEEDEVPLQDESNGSDDSTSSSESDSGSENDEAQDTDTQKKKNAPVSLPVKPEVGSESGSGSADEDHVERPILLEDEEESHVQKRASITHKPKCLANNTAVASLATRRIKKPQAVRAFDKVKKAPAMSKEETLSSEEKESSVPARFVKCPLPGGRPPKPQAVRRLTNVMKSRKIQVNSETARTDRKAGKASSKQKAA